MKSISIIGGTGMKKLFAHPHYQDFEFVEISSENIRIQTKYGNVPATVQILEKKGQQFRLQFVHRHHGLGTTPPHSVNHQANVTAANEGTPMMVLSIHSVGSLVRSFPPGTLGAASDYIDLSGRISTFYNDDAIHTDLTDHFRPVFRSRLRPLLSEQQEDTDIRLEYEHVHAQMYGPQFETPSEIRALGILGATVVGMTMVPEAKLVAELGLPQLALLVSSNWAAGCDPRGKEVPVDHHLVEAQAKKLHRLIWRAILMMLET